MFAVTFATMQTLQTRIFSLFNYISPLTFQKVENNYQSPLPESAQIIADVIGRDATLDLVGHLVYNHLIHKKRGKCRMLYIPKSRKKLTENYWLVKAVGLSNAILLQEFFGGSLLYLAQCKETERGERDNKIVNDFKSGLKVNELALKYNLSVRSIYNIIYNYRQSTSQQQQRNDTTQQHNN